MSQLDGRTILVSGASSGLGRGIAIVAAEAGAKVILVSRDANRLATVKDELAGCGHAVEPFDLRQTDQIPPWLKSVAQRHGPLDGLVHSAGVLTTTPLRMQTSQDWDQAMRINVFAAAALVKGFRQPGVLGSHGSIVLISSIMGLVGQPGQVLYSATKGAVISMVRSMALELAREKIRVNAIAPAVVSAGMTDAYRRAVSAEQFDAITRMHPLGLGTDRDVGNAATFLLADTARWITGTTLILDGGYSAQ